MVVKTSKCVNQSHRYKELKGSNHGQKKPNPQRVECESHDLQKNHYLEGIDIFHL